MTDNTTGALMPRYKCHKEVFALKIKDIQPNTSQLPEAAWVLVFEERGYGSVAVSDKWIESRGAKPGGYYVVYEDGYASWSPSGAFESGYALIGTETPATSPTKGLSFGDAIAAMKAGSKVCRVGWNGKGMWLALQVPDERSKMGLPYIYMSTVTGQLVPWLASQTDMLAMDWEVVV